MHFQQFEDLKFLFFLGAHAPGPPQNPCRVSNRHELGGIVPILLENPKSWLDLSRDTDMPILENSSHKPKSIRFLIRLTNRLTWISRRMPSCSHDE